MLTEHVAQMAPMLILAGLAVAWMAEVVFRAGGYGFLSDVAVGLIGSVIVGTSTWIFVSSNIDMTTMFFLGCAGAALAIVAQRSLWHPLRVRA